jgi:hypothetical protein
MDQTGPVGRCQRIAETHGDPDSSDARQAVLASQEIGQALTLHPPSHQEKPIVGQASLFIGDQIPAPQTGHSPLALAHLLAEIRTPPHTERQDKNIHRAIVLEVMGLIYGAKILVVCPRLQAITAVQDGTHFNHLLLYIHLGSPAPNPGEVMLVQGSLLLYTISLLVTNKIGRR